MIKKERTPGSSGAFQDALQGSPFMTAACGHIQCAKYRFF
jgi:hypothetical protein